MTPDVTFRPIFDPRRLLVNVMLAFVGTAIFLAALLMLINDSAWWRGYVAAAVVSAIASTVSMLPLLRYARQGLTQALAGHFLSAGIRALVSIGGCALAVLKGGYPRTATMLLMVVFYFALVAVESTMIAKAMWNVKT